MNRFICIHGHFYQPPRENPWLETVEVQDSAYPYHDWNERVTAECYGPNTAARLFSGDGNIAKITNNYAKLNFNLGPTLLSWMEHQSPDVYAAILEADKLSVSERSGHGSAIAQAYNHMIMPLANSRDKRTQVLWGIADFKHRFGRDPEGMWLPETAVDIESLELMAEAGLKYTILAPHQAGRARKSGTNEWFDTSGGKIDPRRPYLCLLPSGKEIAIFFYDGPVSRAVAFERLLERGERFADRLTGLFDDRESPQLAHIATDGETYGHHHKYGEMALAYALDHIEANKLATLTNYGEYLEQNPPAHEAEIIEDTSWSCAHGVQRWTANCGCNSGGHGDWNQEWRGPLRKALDWLRDAIAGPFENLASQHLRDPWAARDEYISVILDRSPESLDRFLYNHATDGKSSTDRATILKLMELQRNAMLMYTSCGWFFDELSGIETVQVILYAGRVIQLADDLFGMPLEEQFLNELSAAKSNIPQYGDGRKVYELFVRPSFVDWERLGAHFGISSLFSKVGEADQLQSYSFNLQQYHRADAGRASLAVGQIRAISDITQESVLLSFGVLHTGDHNINCGVRMFRGRQSLSNLIKSFSDAFERAEFAEVIRMLDKEFGESTYSLRSLFRDEQRRIMDLILDTTLADVQSTYRQVYSFHAPLMRFLVDIQSPLPGELRSAAELVLNKDLIEALNQDSLDFERVKSLVQEITRLGLPFDAQKIQIALEAVTHRLFTRLKEQPENPMLIGQLQTLVELIKTMPVDLSLWTAQNIYYDTLHQVASGSMNGKSKAQPAANGWFKEFKELGSALSIAV